MWQWIVQYDHVVSAMCDIFCTAVMVVNIVANRTKISENRSRIDGLETKVCPNKGQYEKEQQ